MNDLAILMIIMVIVIAVVALAFYMAKGVDRADDRRLKPPQNKPTTDGDQNEET